MLVLQKEWKLERKLVLTKAVNKSGLSVGK